MFKIEKQEGVEPIEIFGREILFKSRLGARSAKKYHEVESKMSPTVSKVKNGTASSSEYQNFIEYSIQLVELRIVEDGDKQYLADCMLEKNGEDEILTYFDIIKILDYFAERSEDVLEEDTTKK